MKIGEQSLTSLAEQSSNGPAALSARNHVFDAAVQLFSEKGYVGTSMRDIARVVGILPGSLYAHIDSKESLLIEIVETGIDEFLNAVLPFAESAQPCDLRMRGAIKAHLGVVARNQPKTLVVFHQWRYLSDPNRSRIVAKRRRYEQVFTAIVEEGIRTGVFSIERDVRITVLSILGSLNWAAEWFSPDGPETSDEVGIRLADTLLYGLM